MLSYDGSASIRYSDVVPSIAPYRWAIVNDPRPSGRDPGVIACGAERVTARAIFGVE